MTVHSLKVRDISRPAVVVLACALGAGCAGMSDKVSSAFVDPAKYDLFSCTQLRAAREANVSRMQELRGLMAKAETGVAGPVVSQVAYGNDYLSAQAQTKLADEVWLRNHCDSEPLPAAKPDPAATAQDLSAKGKRHAAGIR